MIGKKAKRGSKPQTWRSAGAGQAGIGISISSNHAGSEDVKSEVKKPKALSKKEKAELTRQKSQERLEGKLGVARSEGVVEGKAIGFESGKKAGFKDGEKEGYEAGLADGRIKGKKQLIMVIEKQLAKKDGYENVQEWVDKGSLPAFWVAVILDCLEPMEVLRKSREREESGV